MVAANELGITMLPRSANPSWQNNFLMCSRYIEELIYEVTCVNGAKLKGGSRPDGIARAATSMGLSVRAHIYGCCIPKLLSWWHPNILKEMGRIHVPVKSGSPPKLKSNERMIVLVSAGVMGFHYVLYRPDGTYMDPALGTNVAGTLWGMGQGGYLKHYLDTGIYLIVRNEQSLHFHGTPKFFLEV